MGDRNAREGTRAYIGLAENVVNPRQSAASKLPGNSERLSGIISIEIRSLTVVGNQLRVYYWMLIALPGLVERIRVLGFDESQFEESFARSAGPGGQNVNKVSTAVTLRPLPSGLTITPPQSRSQHQNP